jgi:hypothetical protein
VTQAFLPLLVRSQGAIVNVLSLAALASVPFSPAYAISKAAAFSMTQSLRALWAGRGVKVHAVFAGPVDTDMTRSLDIPKASSESVARAILDGMERGEEDIFPDPMSGASPASWRSGVSKVLERQFQLTRRRTWRKLCNEKMDATESAKIGRKERYTITKHKTGTREEWLAARVDLLNAEKELTRRSDELARRRQELPWVRIDKEYQYSVLILERMRQLNW